MLNRVRLGSNFKYAFIGCMNNLNFNRLFVLNMPNLDYSCNKYLRKLKGDIIKFILRGQKTRLNIY